MRCTCVFIVNKDNFSTSDKRDLIRKNSCDLNQLSRSFLIAAMRDFAS